MCAYVYHKQLMSCLHAVAPQDSLFCLKKMSKCVYIMLFACTVHCIRDKSNTSLHISGAPRLHVFVMLQSVPCKTVMGVFSPSTSQEEAVLKC